MIAPLSGEVRLPWSEPAWADEVSAWIHRELSRIGTPPTGAVAWAHRRPWSAFAHVPTARGIVHFKAASPPLRFEAALTRALAAWAPDATVPLLAVEPARGWMLSAHAGEILRSRVRTPSDLRHWDPVLTHYAQLQIELADRANALVELGTPDRRLGRIPSLFDALLEDREGLRLGRPGGLTEAERARLVGVRPRLQAACEALMDSGLPETLVHEEIHDANVLIADDGRPIFTDWSDSCVGHPFFGLLVIRRHVAFRLELSESDPAVERLQQVYLEPWGSYANGDALRRAAATAYRIGMVVRSLAYRATLGPLPESYRIDNDSICGWLQDYLLAEEAL